ncbi:sensor domain-containing protein [Massilia glaciei]|uniref:GGDEF domain-containing protein n=1 Tax=Massilia glaciei TaxID=1524097 RepID=A0A2U2H9Z9_9BURK|nr:EAL domain-containing protein [Massilia glaciei]PWF39536.1 GGDEF domain-containing protein [Massilia glaciei]
MNQSNDTSVNELFKAHPIPMWIYDLETLAFMAVNNAAVAHYGYSEAEFLTRTIADLRPAEDLPRLHENLRNAPPGKLQKSGTWRHCKKDGTLIDVEITSHPLVFKGRACRFLLAHDVTERVQAQLRIARLNRVYAVLSGINSAIVRIRDREALFKEACRLATMEGGFLSACVALVDPADGALAIVAQAGQGIPLRSGAPWPAQRAAREQRAFICNDISNGDCNGIGNDIGADGVPEPMRADLLARGVRAAAAFPLLLGGRPVAVLALFAGVAGTFDEDELKVLNEMAGDLAFALLFFEREKQLNHLAYHDMLTALPNRDLFLDRLVQLLHANKRENQPVAIVLLNVDRFAQINDTLGRHAGDALLAHMARRLESSLPGFYNISRIGGDNFALTLSELACLEDAAAVLEQRIFATLDQPFSIDGKEVRISTRAGLAVFPADGADAETLFKHAEVALRNARSSGQRYLFYAPRMNAALAARVALENELQSALEERQFVMYYQPRIDTPSGRIVSAEALIRWQHPVRGLVGPVEFIGLAEETGLIRPIGAWVIDAVCAQQAAWLAAGQPVVPVAINLSAVQCAYAGLFATISDAIERHGLEARHLEFELTETAVMNNPEEAARNLRALKRLGVLLSLDDFGTGYSSLAQLKRFPFDFVKIDRSFIAGLPDDAEDAAIAAAIIAMAHSLHLRVVAEGVETEAQLELLRTLRCDELQGFYFSRPIPAQGFAALLAADSLRPRACGDP